MTFEMVVKHRLVITLSTTMETEGINIPFGYSGNESQAEEEITKSATNIKLLHVNVRHVCSSC